MKMFSVVSKLTDSSMTGFNVAVVGCCKTLKASDFPAQFST